jgi:3-isopropylmalate/(R)-2-methylmalate dehydratase small subunit
VNANFGCGSSREHAPQAIAKWGIQAIVGESFAEIFLGNCVSLGLPCVTTTPEQVKQLQSLLAKDPQLVVQVDLTTLTVRTDGFEAAVEMPSGLHQMFLAGTWDACGQLVAQAEAIRLTAGKLPYMAWG